MTGKATGFASPAQGYEEQTIDLNRLLVANPPATYFLRLETAEMEELGLPCGSLLVVDRSINPPTNSFVLIQHEGQFLCRLFQKSENSTGYFTNGKEIIYPSAGETELIGTVTSFIKQYDFPH
jgi:DNA polymerase V